MTEIGPAPAPAADAPPARSPETWAERAGLLGAAGLKPVSEKLIPARYLSQAVGAVLSLALVAGCVWLVIRFDWWWMWILAILPVLWTLPGLLLTPRRVRALGYLDGEHELVTASGLMFRSVTTTPYGRVQSVEINEGPIARRFGIARLTFSTASTDSGGWIDGLPREEAERLKELLTRRGIERMQSL